MYGSWAGAFGFFQFMPSTIKNHAIDFNKDNYIDLKNSEDAYASAANYLKIWDGILILHCFYKIEFKIKYFKKIFECFSKKT